MLIAVTSQSAISSSTVMRKCLSENISLSFITSALMHQYHYSSLRSTTLRLSTDYELYFIITDSSTAVIDVWQTLTLLSQDQISVLIESDLLLLSKIITALSMLYAASSSSVSSF